ncbi:unnamed protein product [Gadus morhua 'NCC']
MGPLQQRDPCLMEPLQQRDPWSDGSPYSRGTPGLMGPLPAEGPLQRDPWSDGALQQRDPWSDGAPTAEGPLV